MIYCKTNAELKTYLNVPITDNPQDALACVYEVPVFLEHIKVTGTPIYAVLTDNITYEQMLPLLNQGVVFGTKENMLEVLSQYRRPAPTVTFSNNKIPLVIKQEKPEPTPHPKQVEEQQAEVQQYQNANTEVHQNHNHDMFSRAALGNSQRAHIIAAFSTKGGVGKTSLSINLGAIYAQRGSRSVLLDLDIGTGNAADILGVDNSSNIPNIENWRQYARNLHTSLKKHSSGLYVLPCGPNEFDMTGEDIEDLIDLLSNNFEYILLDFGTKAFFPHARKGLELAEKIYVLATQEQGMVQTLVTRFLQEHEEWVKSGKASLIVNKVSPLGYYKASAIAKMANFRSWHEIPEDTAGFEAAKKAKKTVVQLKKSVSSAAFYSIAGEEVSSAKPQKEKGILNKLFK